MGCGCAKNRKQYEVVGTGGKVLFTSSVESTAKTVSGRYEGSIVREKGSTTVPSQPAASPGTKVTVK